MYMDIHKIDVYHCPCGLPPACTSPPVAPPDTWPPAYRERRDIHIHYAAITTIGTQDGQLYEDSYIFIAHAPRRPRAFLS